MFSANLFVTLESVFGFCFFFLPPSIFMEICVLISGREAYLMFLLDAVFLSRDENGEGSSRDE